MADISKVKSLDGSTTYNVKDATARSLLGGHSVGKDVPSDAKFTDTTYSSKTAASGGTDVSLVTTGEKYTWNNKGSGTITGIKMNGASKGTSGVVDLGTVITAHQDISGKMNASLKGAANGVAELDSNGKVPSSQLPSYVDDVLEYDSQSAFPATGEAGKIYVAKDTNKTYRWSGTAYVEISPSLALGETSSTAYRGDRGKTAYDHSQSTHARTDATAVAASSTNGNIKINGTETTVYTHPGSGTNPHGTTKSDVGLGNVGNFKAVSTVASQGLTDTEKSNARANIGAGTSSLALGTSSSTAYRGDYGNSAYAHAVTNKGSAFANGLYKITTNSEGHVTAATAVAKSDITGLGIPGSDTNTHRPIQVNGTEVLGNNTTALNLKAGSNVSVTNSSGTVTIAATDTTYSSKTAASGGTDVSLVTTGEKYTWNNKANGSHAHSANDIANGYLNIHPENSPTLIPFMHNDIAFLLKRGGSAVIAYDGTTQSVDIGAAFDGSGSYWAMNPTGITTITITLTLHKAFGWTNIIYADFGASGWRSKTVKIEVMNSNYSGDTWTQKYNTTTNGLGHVYVNTSHTPVGASNAGAGFNKIRFTFSVWATSNIFRIAQLGVYNYDSRGLRETSMSRGVDDFVYRSITPGSNGTYSLGSSSNKWKDVYAGTLNGTTIPDSPKFTDTTYSSKTAASGGTDVSLVTTGEKYTWNNKGSYSKPSGGIPDSDIASASTWNAKGTYSKPSGGIPKTDLASAVQTSLGKADSALQSHQTIKQDGVTGATVNRFGTCSTAAGTAAKAVSITTGTFSLETGAMVAVKFSNANTAGTPTLNVNSSGAKNIFVNGAQITTGGNKALLAGTVIFLYDGTQWHLIGNYYDTNTQTVTGVKGNSESSYRTGNVNITAANIGAATSGHTHTTTIAADSGTNQLTLAASTKYKLTAGGTSYIFTTPPNTTYSDATTSAHGLMTAADKTKLNALVNLGLTLVGTI